MLFQWKGPFEIVEVINRMDFMVDVKGVVNPFHANMLKQYVERQNVASHCLMSAEANPFFRVFCRTWTDAEELLKKKSFFMLSFVFLSEFVIRQVQTNIY